MQVEVHLFCTPPLCVYYYATFTTCSATWQMLLAHKVMFHMESPALVFTLYPKLHNVISQSKMKYG